jgi:hypothetical protein
MRCTQVGRVDGKVCGRELVGRRHWCWVHPEAEQDYGPYAGETAEDRRKAAKIDQDIREIIDPQAEQEDCAKKVCLPGFEFPRERPMVVSTFSGDEMQSWVASMGR